MCVCTYRFWAGRTDVTIDDYNGPLGKAQIWRWDGVDRTCRSEHPEPYAFAHSRDGHIYAGTIHVVIG